MFTSFTSSSHARNSGSFTLRSVSVMNPRAPKPRGASFSSFCFFSFREDFLDFLLFFRSLSSSSEPSCSCRFRFFFSFLLFLLFLLFLRRFRELLEEEDDEESDSDSESESESDFSFFSFFTAFFASAAAFLCEASSTSRNALMCVYASSGSHAQACNAATHVAPLALGTNLRSAPKPCVCIASLCASACFSIIDLLPRESGSPSLCREYSIFAGWK
mmetsp:Transcript_6670/g.22507  ORF Transcript_6670/g.22507 Transcript_6670/m.22507 type:complete len:217 (-) Transcript_6670:70-720(-)